MRPHGGPGLDALLRRGAMCDEDPGTLELIRRLRRVRRRGEFSRAEFIAMCRWKSPRATRHYRRNSAATIRAVSRAVLSSRSERRRLELLMGLQGVSVPVASAILTLIDPERYGVLDIRVWKLLLGFKAVTGSPRGRGFGFRHWDDYLRTLRARARRLRVPVRTIEYTLFRRHRSLQTGRLYD